MSKTVKVCLEIPKPMFDLIQRIRTEQAWAACDSIEDYCFNAVRKQNELLLERAQSFRRLG